MPRVSHPRRYALIVIHLWRGRGNPSFFVMPQSQNVICAGKPLIRNIQYGRRYTPSLSAGADQRHLRCQGMGKIPAYRRVLCRSPGTGIGSGQIKRGRGPVILLSFIFQRNDSAVCAGLRFLGRAYSRRRAGIRKNCNKKSPPRRLNLTHKITPATPGRQARY